MVLDLEVLSSTGSLSVDGSDVLLAADDTELAALPALLTIALGAFLSAPTATFLRMGAAALAPAPNILAAPAIIAGIAYFSYL